MLVDVPRKAKAGRLFDFCKVTVSPSPTTCSLLTGVVVPIPTLPSVVIRTRSTSELLNAVDKISVPYPPFPADSPAIELIE